MGTEELVRQLVAIYYSHEYWHEHKMSRIDAWRYHEKLLELGNIITISSADFLHGYVEYWRLTFEQFGRIICNEPFSAICENVQNGQIAYVANTFIRSEYRNTEVYRMLRDRFLESNKECTHFVGEARRKKSSPVKVFKSSDIKSLNKEIIYG